MTFPAKALTSQECPHISQSHMEHFPQKELSLLWPSPSWPAVLGEIKEIRFISLNKQKRSWARQVTRKQLE